MKSVYRWLVLAGFVFIGFWVIFNLYGTVLGIGGRGNITVPDLTNQSVQAARKLLHKNDLEFSVLRSEYNPSVPKDTVISQNPEAGMKVKNGRAIQVVISNGPQAVAVPDLKGLDLRDAILQLENLQLKVGKTDYETHSIAKKDVVIDQNPPAGKSVTLDSDVDLTVSIGPPPALSMPKLVGEDLIQAKTLLQEAKLRLGQVGWRIDARHPSGEILTQNPDPGKQIHEGDMVSLVVSTGQQSETLPFRQSYITIRLPAFDGEQEVTVWVTDATSTNLVYRGVHREKEKMDLMVSGYGNSKVEVYLGSKLLSSGEL